MRTQALCGRAAMLASIAALVAACETMPPPTDPQAALIAKGRRIFFNETFAGNGRTCGSCHPADNNFTIDAALRTRSRCALRSRAPRGRVPAGPATARRATDRCAPSPPAR